MLRSTRLLAILFAAFTLMLGACGDDDDATDAGTPTPDAQADGTVTPDATPDVAEEVTEDAVAEVAEDVEEEIVADNFCLNATDGALLVESEENCVEFVLDGDPPVPVGYTIGECAAITDDSEYLVDWLGDAVGHCAASPPTGPTGNPHTCIGCLTGPDTCFPASDTDPDEYDLTSCVLECIALSAEDATMPPIHDAVIDSGLSEDCAGCFAGITACILGNNCAGACLADSDSCACHECSCGLTDTDLGRDCANEFALCTGVDPYIDCGDLASCE